MTFLYPFAFLLLPLYWICEKRCFGSLPKLPVANLSMLLQAAGGLGSRERWLRWLIVVLMVTALADPVIKKERTLHTAEGYAIALLLDASFSMREGDRFGTAKKVLRDFIARRPNDRIGLEVFGDYAHLAAPMSYDKRGLETILKYLRPGVAGGRDTALYEALFSGARLFEKEKEGQRLMILLTDGIDTVHNLPLDVAIRQLKKEKIRVYAIGVGDDFRREVLQKIARETGGRFFSAGDAKKLATIYGTIDRLEKSPIETVRYTEIRHFYRYPLGVAIALLLLFWILKIRQRRGALPVGLSLLLSLLALYGPTLPGEPMGIRRSGSDLLVAVDLSRSMEARDLYPDRLRFSLHKIRRLLSSMRTMRVGILLFADRTYLLAPPSGDYRALEALLVRLDTESVERGASDWNALIAAASKLGNSGELRPLLIFSDGEGIGDPQALAHQAREEKLLLYGYGAATEKGVTIPEGKGLLRDAAGDVVVTRLNESFAELVRESGGDFMEAESDDSDMKKLAAALERRFGSSKRGEETVRRERQLFWLPLSLALLTFVVPWRRGVRSA